MGYACKKPPEKDKPNKRSSLSPLSWNLELELDLRAHLLTHPFPLYEHAETEDVGGRPETDSINKVSATSNRTDDGLSSPRMGLGKEGQGTVGSEANTILV